MESRDTKLKQLTDVFRRAGAKDPESWASSEVDEGINQLARFSFLKAISAQWLREDAFDWVDDAVKQISHQPDDPGAQLPAALQEMLDKGVSKEAIVDLVRVIQFDTLFHVCSVIDGSIDTDTPVSDWALYETDEDDNPIDTIGGLHESLLEFDPSDKEMRPRDK